MKLTSFFASHSTNQSHNQPAPKLENLGECMDMSVLERQRAMLQRLHSWQNQERRDHVNMHSAFEPQDLFSNCWQPSKPDLQHLNATDHPALPYPETDHKRSYSTISSSNNNSSMTKLTMPKHQRQCNSSTVNREGSVSCSIKKRKAEFDVEEDFKDKGLEAEEAGEEKSEITTKTERELSTHTCSKESSKVQKPDYIHVRARRGQATDSHSLAERARREKISKKMKCLQDLVPSCNKVTGKAGILDEIINYVQSLQKQVEFLSMKLAVSNPRLDFSIGDLFTKELPAYITSLPEAAIQLEASTSTCYQYNPMQQGNSNCGTDISVNESQMMPQKIGTSSVPIPEVFLDSSSIHQLQQLSGWDSDCPNLFNAGFHYS